MYYKIMLNASKSFVKKSFWTRNSLCIISRPKLSTSIYNLMLIYVCHFHHHFLQWQLFTFDHYRDTIVLLSLIPASKEFCAKVWVSFICNVLIVDVTFILSTSLEISDISPILPQMRSKRFRTPILLT